MTKKRIFLIVLIAVALAVASYELTTPIRMKGVVRRLLRSPDVKVEVATKLVGGFEPTYAAIIAYDTARAPELCRSLNLTELDSEDRDMGRKENPSCARLLCWDPGRHSSAIEIEPPNGVLGGLKAAVPGGRGISDFGFKDLKESLPAGNPKRSLLIPAVWRLYDCWIYELRWGQRQER
jgi:hypothetical protein